MKKQSKIKKIICMLPLCIFLTFIIALINSSCTRQAKSIPIRIGYASQTAIHCHLGQIFEKTDILKKHNLEASITPIKRGDEQTELVKSGKIDITFNCDVPTIRNLDTLQNLRILATPGSLGSIHLLVKADSGAKSLKDLKGKIGVRQGSVAHRFLLNWLKEERIHPPEAPEIFDLPSKKDDLLQSLESNDVAGVVAWDPTASELILTKEVKSIKSDVYYSQAMVTLEYFQKNPDGVKAFISALKESLSYLGSNKQQVNQWASQISGFPPEALDMASMANQYYKESKKPEEIDVNLGEKDIKTLQDCVIYARENNMIQQDMDIKSYLAK